MDGTGGAQSWHPLWYGVGAVLALMIGGMLGASFVRERGRRVLPVVITSTLVLAAVLGWALDFVMYAFYASAFH
jgi:putative effector of murein hydrolase LrgA (UPF0299 family)